MTKIKVEALFYSRSRLLSTRELVIMSVDPARPPFARPPTARAPLTSQTYTLARLCPDPQAR